ncbi:hypothetical protein FRACYDRAFT_249161 [Fragilariopsis cylindrus CCMP1102]|uniref:Uncharacterized protein n=1 Tax=Fragilariopsis cylindrus CCMP1102 TaxID=635003 RepID=A0A1E7ESH6_9STRA|nr:hypothetical protein FRACYDRAFT_249161 [Fragilariopsis cylindrus CCMP1102]|eukprot:OEU08819.1 hypothetical protein FRACYDRAFT_249161 [Fragilariopsis cylindrus CCMP1102]
MVMDILCAVNLAANAMVNGICCCYQMNEENKRREAHEATIQRAIRDEFDRQAMMVQQHNSKTMQEKDDAAAASLIQDQRRRKLMKEKNKANNNIAANNNNRGDQSTEESNHVVGPITIPLLVTDNNNSFLRKVIKSKLRISLTDIPSNLLVSSRDSFINSSAASSRNSCLTSRLNNGELSSLFDESLDDEDDDFQEILIE